MAADKRIVVVGGGPAGLYFIDALIKKKAKQAFSITVVEPKEFLDNSPYVPYGVARWTKDADNDAAIEKWSALTLQNVLDQMNSKTNSKVKHVRALVTKISDDFKKVTCSNGDVLDADILVIATGTRYPLWKADVKAEVEVQQRRQEIRRARDALVKAKTVLVVGGGEVGVETAGEIADSYPDKKLIFATGSQGLLFGIDKRCAEKTAAHFRDKKNVTLLLNERVERTDDKKDEVAGGYGPGSFVSDKSKTKIDADLVFWCGGMQSQNDFLAEMKNDILTPKGWIKVNRAMQVNGQKHVFAIGDCNDGHQAKTQVNAEIQGVATADNVIRVAAGEDAKDLTDADIMRMVTFSQNGGVFHGPVVLTGWTNAGSCVPAMMKEMILSIMFGHFYSK